MTISDEVLPRFDNPPVVETVLGVFFRRLEEFTTVHQGIFWDRCFHSKFPKLEERPAVDEFREQFGEELLKPGPPIRWEVSDRPPARRLWAASESGEHVVQIQKNAMLANWLKAGEKSAYRPYLEKRQEFAEQLDQLDQFIDEEQIGRIEPTSCVVTYINHIEFEGVANMAPTVAQTLTAWSNQTSDGWLPEPDKVTLRFAFPMPDNLGRLNANISPAVRRRDNKQMLRLDLTARGPVAGRELKDAMDWIDLGHEWVVRGFTSLTEPEMHNVWGIKR